jgi:hypothetical protein
LHEQLTDRVDADHDEDGWNAGEQLRPAEGEPVQTRHRIGADGGDHQSEDARHEPFDERLAGQRGDDAETEDAECEIGSRREGERQRGQPLRQQDQHHQTEQAADEARVERDAERFARAPLLLHRVSVDHGRRRSVGAGSTDQNGGNRSAVLGAHIRRREHDDGHRRIESVGEGQQQRHRDRRRDPGQGAAENAPGHSAEGGGDDG